MRLHVYLRNSKVFIPTMGAVHKRLYRDIEPVAVVDVSNSEGIRQALHARIASSNPPTPYYPRGAYPQPVVLKHAGVKTWSAFAHNATPWKIRENDGNYQIIGYHMGRDGWAEDPQQKNNFSPGTSVDSVIDRMIAILQEAVKKPKDR
jgi:hypothetical protein